MKNLLILLLVSFFTKANSPKEEYINFMEQFMNNKSLSFDFEMVQNLQNQKIAYQGFFKRNGQNYKIKTGEYLLLANDELSLTIFEEDKVILLDVPSPADQRFIIDVSKMTEALNKVTEISGSQKTIKQWVVFAKGWEGKAYIKANIEKQVPEQISFYGISQNIGKEKPVMKIDFMKVSKSPVKESTFDIGEYIQKKNNNYTLTKKYNSYEFINNLD